MSLSVQSILPTGAPTEAVALTTNTYKSVVNKGELSSISITVTLMRAELLCGMTAWSVAVTVKNSESPVISRSIALANRIFPLLEIEKKLAPGPLIEYNICPS